MPERLNELRSVQFSNAHFNCQNGTMQLFQGYADFMAARAKVEREYAKKLAELCQSFDPKAVEYKKVPLPTAVNAWSAMVSETMAASKTHDLMSGKLEIVSKQTTGFVETAKATAKRLNNDRLAEESAIRNWDQDVNNYLRKASDSLKLAQLDPQERAGLRGKVFTLSGDETQQERERGTALSKVAHNEYFMRNLALNFGRDAWFDEELVAMMDQAEDLVWTYTATGMKKQLEDYAAVLTEAASSGAQNVATLRESGPERMSAAEDNRTLVEVLTRVKPDAVPFAKPAPRKFVDTGYGEQLVIDEHTVLTLSSSRRSFQEQLGNSVKQLQKFESEREGLNKMVIAYTDNPALGSAQSLHDKILENEKCARMLRLRIKRLNSMVQVLDQCGIDGSVRSSHKWAKPSMFKSATMCVFCGERAGGLKQAVGTPALKCGECGIFVHEGKCATLCWKGCKKDSLYDTVKGINPDALPVAQQQAVKPKACLVIGNITGFLVFAAQLASKPSVTSEPPKETATVLYDYQAERDDEISLEINVVVEVVSKEGDWVKVRHNGREGMYPASFLDFAVQAAPEIIHIPDETPAHADEPDEVLQDTRSSVYIKRVRAIYEYAAQDADQLTLAEGDVLDVLAEEDDGWSRGILNGTEGLFPTAYCEEL